MAGWLSGLFGPKEFTIASIKISEVEKEVTRVQGEQERLAKEVGKIEKQKKDFFEQGVGKASVMEKRILAGRIKQLDEDGKDHYVAQARLAKKERALGKLLRIKQSEGRLRDGGLWDKLSGMEAGEFERFVANAKVEVEHGDKTAETLLDVLGEGITSEVAADPEIDDIVKQMEAASFEGAGADSVRTKADEGPAEETGEGS